MPQRETTADIESNNPHRRRGSAKRWHFPGASSSSSYINIVSSIRRDSFSPKLHRKTEKKLFSSPVIAGQDCLQRFRETKNTHFLADSLGQRQKKKKKVRWFSKSPGNYWCISGSTLKTEPCCYTYLWVSVGNVLEYFTGGAFLSRIIFNAWVKWGSDFLNYRVEPSAVSVFCSCLHSRAPLILYPFLPCKEKTLFHHL